MPESLMPEAARRIYRVLCNLAAVDGQVAASERAVLKAAQKDLGLADAEATTLEAEGRAGKELVVGEDEAERRRLMKDMLKVVAADGRLDAAEADRVRELAGKLGLDRQKLENMIMDRLMGKRR